RQGDLRRLDPGRRPVRVLEAQEEVGADERPEERRLGGDEDEHPPAAVRDRPSVLDRVGAHASAGSLQCQPASANAASPANTAAMKKCETSSIVKSSATQIASTTGQPDSAGISSTSSISASRTVEAV